MDKYNSFALPFAITEDVIEQNLALALNRNFKSLEQVISQLLVYENQIGLLVNNVVTEKSDNWDQTILDLNTLSNSLGDLSFEDAVETAMLGESIFIGGYFATGLVHAGRIDTGTLNADRIAANSVTASKIAVDDLSAIAAKFTQLVAGTSGGARIEMGSSSGNPYFRTYDSSNHLRVKLEPNELQFLRGSNSGTLRGRIRAEYISDVYRGAAIGEVLLVEAVGNAIALYAGGPTTPCIVYPNWVWISGLEVGNIHLGYTDPPQWVLQPYIGTDDEEFEIFHLNWRLTGAGYGLWMHHTQGFEFGQNVRFDGYINCYGDIYVEGNKGVTQTLLIQKSSGVQKMTWMNGILVTSSAV